MAKNYIKPSIAFEKLAMSSELSTSCTMDITFAEFACPVLIPEWGETVFSEDLQCDWTNDEFYICYHVPTVGSNVFGS